MKILRDCKLCIKPMALEDLSSADPKLCKECYSDIAYYNRNSATKQTTRLNSIVAKFQASLRRGGYTPRSFGAPVLWYKCETCDKHFESPVVAALCGQCRLNESTYLILRKQRYQSRNPKRKKNNELAKLRKLKGLDELENKYRMLLKMGKRVPAAFLRDKETGEV